MKLNLIVIDDFYTNPMEVRKFALEQDFNVTGNFPGYRTKSFMTEEIKQTLSSIFFPHAGRITYWYDSNVPGSQSYSGAFQYCTSHHRTWIHADSFNSWAGVCYLTPNAPLSSGTALYRHTKTGDYAKHGTTHAADSEGNDYTKWEMIDRIGNKFNRLVLYKANLFHAAMDYFGVDKETGRLFQTFFLNTEK